MSVGNPYVPKVMRIESVVIESPDVKTFVIETGGNFTFRPGQFVIVGVPGYGEAPFAIASSFKERNFFEITVRAIGDVTKALHRLGVGDVVLVRGPYGKGYPLDELERKNLVIIAGGTGLIGVSSLLWYVFEERSKFGDVYLLYGARTPRDIIRKRDIRIWGSKNIRIYLSVDRTDGLPWDGHVGFVTDFIDTLELPIENTCYVICGPPIMMKVSYKKLLGKGIKPNAIYVSLERHMKCGIGKCGRCLLSNGLYVCKDGPVFRCDKLPEREIE